MYNSLDSRAFGQADCYGQRFMRPGTYRYNVVPGFGAMLSTDRPFVVHVKEGTLGAGTAQHNLLIKVAGKGFDVSERELTVGMGDLVLWNCNNTETTPAAVVGDQDFFKSQRLVNGSVYSHAFGTAGEFHWIDAIGRKLGGVVRVKDPGVKTDADMKRWQAQLAKGTVVTIHDNKVEPADVTILTGQTVFFAVMTSHPVTITDKTLLHGVDGDQVDAGQAGPGQGPAG